MVRAFARIPTVMLAQAAAAFCALLVLAGGDGIPYSTQRSSRHTLTFIPRSSRQPERRYSYENTSYQQRNVRRNIYEVNAPASQEDAVSYFAHLLNATPNPAFAPIEVPEGDFLSLTKQVSTVGPATNDTPSLKSIMDAGTDVFRINFSHGTRTSKVHLFRIIRQLELQPSPEGASSSGSFVLSPRAILGDIQGPKLRIGKFMPNADVKGKGMGNSDADYVDLKKGDEFTFDTADVKGTLTRVQFNYPDILRGLEVGNVVSLDDGNISMRVIEVNQEAPYVKAVVLNDGVLSSRKGLAVPNVAIPVDLLSEKDVKDTVFSYAAGADFLGVSFVQKTQDILYIKNVLIDFAESPYLQPLRNRMDELGVSFESKDEEDPELEAILDTYYHEHFLPNKSKFMTAIPSKENVGLGIIPKIEKQPALDDINGILEVSDGLMIARGDLGVETELTNLPVTQKRLVQLCRLVYHKPVIVATQMLETMRKNPKPTRAETTDCANAVYDGADAVMLSAESATGLYPAHTVSVQRLICRNAERDPHFSALQIMKEMMLHQDLLVGLGRLRPREVDNINKLMELDLKTTRDYEARHADLVASSDRLSETLATIDVDALAIHADDVGDLVQWVASKRHTMPIIFLTTNVELARRLQLTWSVKPHMLPIGANATTFAQEIAPLYVQQKGKVLMVESSENKIKSSLVFEVL
ncbi:Pyruvate kinase [Babesia sp. Xinjiang]|uniref:Pyruvate kinase n=1 Tax=Babesia sp. Xinjiang TaxID=462227 RepID=UPI000A242FF7|nr:Pyruvate kinase [Babesia sp. Xinjiang]ORM41826.1 Pyruvate kinase [Babesia sp. Xinjiang]